MSVVNAMIARGFNPGAGRLQAKQSQYAMNRDNEVRSRNAFVQDRSFNAQQEHRNTMQQGQQDAAEAAHERWIMGQMQSAQTPEQARAIYEWGIQDAQKRGYDTSQAQPWEAIAGMYVQPQGKRQILEQDGIHYYTDTGERVLPNAQAPEEAASFEDESKLRGEFQGQTKDFRNQQAAMGRIIASAKEPSAAGDLALIFNYMKMLDPGSTVREGEFATAQNSAGVPERVRAWYNNIKDGQRMTPDQRRDFVNRAGEIYGEAARTYDITRSQYKGLAESYKANPDRVGLMDVQYQPEDYAVASPKPGTVEGDYVFLGGDPSLESSWKKQTSE